MIGIITFFGAGILASIIFGGGATIIIKINAKDALRIAFGFGVSSLILFIINKIVINFNIFSVSDKVPSLKAMQTQMIGVMRTILLYGHIVMLAGAILFLILAICKLLINKSQKQENKDE